MFAPPCQSPLDEPVVLTDEVIFPLTVSLDKLPVSTLKVKVRVTLTLTLTLVLDADIWCCVKTVSRSCFDQ